MHRHLFLSGAGGSHAGLVCQSVDCHVMAPGALVRATSSPPLLGDLVYATSW